MDKTRLPESNVRVAGEPELVAVEQIIAAEEPRVPAAPDSQHEFRAALLMLTRLGQEVSDADVICPGLAPRAPERRILDILATLDPSFTRRRR